MTTYIRKMMAALIVGFLFTSTTFAQDAAAEETSKEAAGAVTNGPMDIFMDNAPVGPFIWILIFLSSAAMMASIIDGVITIKKEKLMPDDLVDGIRDSLEEGDLDAAIAYCEEHPSPLSNILLTGFSNISEGYEVIQESVGAAAEMESEKLLQRVNLLNMIGQIAPMLGLLGTVTGMVSAFSGLASAEGAEKAAQLALSISGALWTTCAGLLVSVPALVGFTFIKNKTVQLILESEALVIDLIKTLRDAEVAED